MRGACAASSTGSTTCQTPDGFKTQLIVQKLYLNVVPRTSYASCGYGVIQQSVPVLNIANPNIASSIDISGTGADDPAAPSLPILPGETVRVTYRVVKVTPDKTIPLSTNQPLAKNFGASGVKPVGKAAARRVQQIRS